MEKVLIWGTGATYQNYSGFFQNLIEKEEMEILALIDRDNDKKEIDGYKVIRKEEIAFFEFDRIIIVAVGAALKSIKNDVESLRINDVYGGEKILTVVEYEMEYAQKQNNYYKDIIDNQLKIIARLLAASDEEVINYDWMHSMICQYGVYPFDTGMKHEESLRFTQFGIMQVVDEFAKYCNFIGTLNIRSAIEVGVFRGRTSYFICALLARNNPELTYTMVDIYDNLDAFEKFQKLLPMLEKRIPSTSADYKGKAFDFVFIDADHSYDGSIEDYYNVGQYAKKLVCFHDIYGHEYDKLNGGTVRTWREVQQMAKDNEHMIFSKYPEKWMGIGCVLKEGTATK